MSTLIIIDAHSNEQISVEVNVEEHDRHQAWRIRFHDGRNALIGIDQHGIWQQFGGDVLDSRLILNIGQAIEKQQSS